MIHILDYHRSDIKAVLRPPLAIVVSDTGPAACLVVDALARFYQSLVLRRSDWVGKLCLWVVLVHAVVRVDIDNRL